MIRCKDVIKIIKYKKQKSNKQIKKFRIHNKQTKYIRKIIFRVYHIDRSYIKMNNPSYYYQHKPKRLQYEQNERQNYGMQQNDNDSNQNTQQDNNSSKQQWQYVDSQFVQYNNTSQSNIHNNIHHTNIHKHNHNTNIHKHNHNTNIHKHNKKNNGKDYKNKDKNYKNNEQEQQSSSQLSSNQQKDRFNEQNNRLYNQKDNINNDRSLKMQKSIKKINQMNQIHHKNKSLSSPCNKYTSITMFKKQPNKHSNPDKLLNSNNNHNSNNSNNLNNNDLNNNNKLKNERIKKEIKQKQKKISNGSLSTNYTKIRNKKPKISKKMIQQKQLSKSNVSQKSNQFLVLGQQLYDYQDMSKVNTKGYNSSLKINNNGYKQNNNLYKQNNNLSKQNNNKQTNKKVTSSYYQHENGSNNINNNNGNSHFNSFSIYDQTKLNKKVYNSIVKIQKYIMGFVQAQGFQQAKQQALRSTQKLSIQAKLQLYNTLMNDTQLLKQLQTQNKQKQINKIDDVIKLSIRKVQKKSQKLTLLYSNEQSLISKWKNSKLHQLSTARKILQKLVQQQNNITEKRRWQSIQSQQSFQSDIDLLDQDNDPLLVLEKQLQLVMNQQYYPQLKKHTINLRKSINQLLKNQHFPSPKIQSETQITERHKLEDTKNYFTPNGVLWFFQKFFSFIIEKPNYLQQLVEKLNQGYGFDVETKKLIARTQDLQKWYQFFDNDQNVNHKPLIDDDLFHQFQQAIIRTDPQIRQQMFVWMHHFNQAIIDCFNQEFHRCRPFYPYGQPIPFLQKPGKYFQITTQSIFYFFQKCKIHVYTNYITFFAGLILPEGHQETKQTKKYNITKEIKALNQDILYDWERYHCTQPIAKLSALEALYQEIEAQIFDEIKKQIFFISLKM